MDEYVIHGLCSCGGIYIISRTFKGSTEKIRLKAKIIGVIRYTVVLQIPIYIPSYNDKINDKFIIYLYSIVIYQKFP